MAVNLPLIENKPSKCYKVSINDHNPNFMKYIDPSGDPQFWNEVESKLKEKQVTDNEDFSRYMNEVRAERIWKDLDGFKNDSKQDPVLIMLTEWYDEFETYSKNGGHIEFQHFQREVISLAKLLIEGQYSLVKENPTQCRYSKFFIADKESDVCKTLLHVVADEHRDSRKAFGKQIEQRKDFTLIAECLLSFDSNLIYDTTEGEEWEMLPVELALVNLDDSMAELLIKAMQNKDRVRMLFEYDYAHENAPRFRFIDYVGNKSMQKTTFAILDSLVSPCIPLLPCDEEFHRRFVIAFKEPKQFQFNFRLLDGDLNGRRPYLDGIMKDGNFDVNQISCLQAICMSKVNQVAIKHPVVRLLARRKWEAYGRFYVRLHMAIFMAFLLVMSVSLLTQVHNDDHNKRLKRAMVFCESITMLLSIGYFLIEIDQLFREKSSYWHDFFNYIDLIGILSLMIALVMKWADTNGQLAIAACAYIVNHIRVFKYFSAFRGPGIYIATISILIKENLPTFLSVYCILLASFSGGCYIVMKGSAETNATIGLLDVLLRGFRGVAEGQVFADSYEKFSPFAVVIILGGMFATTLILSNILIAQLTDSFADVKKNAVIQYDIAKASFVTRIENSRIKSLCLRLKYYQESSFSSEEDLFIN